MKYAAVEWECASNEKLIYPPCQNNARGMEVLGEGGGGQNMHGGLNASCTKLEHYYSEQEE